MSEPSTSAAPSAPRIDLISFARDTFERAALTSIAQVLPYLQDPTRTVWLDIEGMQSADLVPELERILPLHPVAADLLRDGSARSMVEDFGEHYLATMVFMHGERTPEVIDFIFTPRLIVTVQERPGDCFDVVRERLRAGTGRVRELGSEFLFALLGRAICDSYQPVFDRIDQRFVKFESAIARHPEPAMLARIHMLRARLMNFRQQIVPLRESITALLARRAANNRSMELALRSLHDELAVLQDELDSHRDGVQRLSDLYMNSVSNRLNDVMRVLTIISTIFMPLSFMASVYGMNFDIESSPWNMPELRAYYGYPLALLAMSTVASSLIFFSWRKGWIGGGSARRGGIDGLALDLVDLISSRNAAASRAKRRRGKRGASSRARSLETSSTADSAASHAQNAPKSADS